jgi:hypothetical protein
MIAEPPELSNLRPWFTPSRLEGRIEIKRLRTLALLPSLEPLEESRHLVLVEARERQVQPVRTLEVGQEPGEELLVPAARDPVEGETEETRPIRGDVEPDDRHGCQAEPAGCDEALMAADDDPVLPSGEDRLDKAELAETPGQGLQLILADPARVGGVRREALDRDVLDGQGREGDGHDRASRPRKVEHMAPEPEKDKAARRAELNRRLRIEFVEGAEERSRRELGRGPTADELRRVLRRYPGDLPEP